MALLLLSCAVLLSGCETLSNFIPPIGKDQSSYTENVCADYPEEPTGNFTQKDVAEYAIDGKAAWMDCRNKAQALTLITKMRN